MSNFIKTFLILFLAVPATTFGYEFSAMTLNVDNLFDNDNYYALSTGDHETNYRKSVTALPPRVMGLDIRYRF